MFGGRVRGHGAEGPGDEGAQRPVHRLVVHRGREQRPPRPLRLLLGGRARVGVREEGGRQLRALRPTPPGLHQGHGGRGGRGPRGL